MPITISLETEKETGRKIVSMPVDFQVSSKKMPSSAPVGWEIRIDGKSVTVPWLVSFRDGTVFEVVTIDEKQAREPAGTRTQSPDVRNGQGIDFAGARPGRYSYRLAFCYENRIYGIFDCPSIIIW